MRFYLKRWWCIPLLPFFNLAVFFIRVAGIINSIQTDSAWRQMDLTEERNAFNTAVKSDAARLLQPLRRVRRAANRPPNPVGAEKEGYGALWYFSVGTLAFLGMGLALLVYWSKSTFHVEITEIIHTLQGPLQGTGAGMMNEALRGLVLPLGGCAAVLVAAAMMDAAIGRRLKKRGKGAYQALHSCAVFGSSLLLLGGVLYGNGAYGLLDYF